MDESLDQALSRSEELARGERYSDALDILRYLIEDRPEEARIWVARAYINGRQGAHEAAVADMSKAMSIRNSEPHYAFTRGLDYFALGRYDDAVNDFTRVIELCDQHRSDYYRIAAYLCRADAYVREA